MTSALLEATMVPPERELIARCRAGDTDAFAEIYADHAAVVFRFAVALVGDREDGHDLGQETFLRAFRAIGGFCGECSARAWLLRICANLCRGHLRSRRRQARTSDALAGEFLASERAAPDPALLVEQAATTELIRRALGGLPPAHRELILLREYEELSHEEIAVIHGCGIATVRVKLFRARRLLKERVEALLDPR